ncbi:MAG: STAS/SEC14 domain-containing protein [Bacteroidales bacterium]
MKRGRKEAEVPLLESYRTGDSTFEIAGQRIALLGDGVLRIEAIGDMDDDKLDRIRAVYRDVFSLAGDAVRLLVDLNQTGHNPPEARRFWRSLSAHKSVEAIAMVGIHPVARVLATFVIGSLGLEKYRFFEREEDALDWLTHI